MNLHKMRRILFVLGTRPEAIKLLPVVLQLRMASSFEAKVCVTGQHRQLLDQVLAQFKVQADYDLDVMGSNQSLFQSTSKIIASLEPIVKNGFDCIVVQGDTTSTLCGALAGFYSRVPVAHVEAGLRTGNYNHPFPEEMNRVLTSRLASLHLAATSWAAENLQHEGVPPQDIVITGNPVTDAIRIMSARQTTSHQWPFLDASKRLILVTAHRRESFGTPFEHICGAIRELAQRGDTQLVYPVHPNPHVRSQTESMLAGVPNIVLIEPLDYAEFVDLMRKSYLILTDSGGVQEEAPSLGKPVLVMRETTERPEAVQAGTAILVGTDKDLIVQRVQRLLENETEYSAMAQLHNPYGDGFASARIQEALERFLNTKKLHTT